MRRRILYIEDDAESAAMVRVLIEGTLPDVMVETCSSLAGAEAHLNRTCYDVIICDFCLPPDTGAMVAEKVLARDPNQPFYLMSQYIGKEVRAEAERVGVELHGKFTTVSPAEFLRSIDELLQKRPCAEMATTTGESDDASSSKSVTSRRQSEDCDSAIENPTSPSAESAMVAIGGLGNDDTAGSIGNSAESRASVDPPSGAGNPRQSSRGDIRRPSPIRLTSRHVLAARAQLGRA